MLARKTPHEGAGQALYLYTIVLVAAVGGFLWGYDLSLISGAGLCIKAEYTLVAGWFGAVTGSAVLGSPFGSMLGVWMADRFGRKRTLIFAALLTVISTVGCALAGGIMELIIWRFVGGAGVGLASTVSPMYIAEVAPAALARTSVVVNQLAIVIGLVTVGVRGILLSSTAITGGGCSPRRAFPSFVCWRDWCWFPKARDGWPRSAAMTGRLAVLAKNQRPSAGRDGIESRSRTNWATKPAASQNCSAPAFARPF